MKTFEADAVCTDCKGTGIYEGFAEKDGAGVVCSTCKGTGCKKIFIKYEPFEKRNKTDKIKRVYKVNPGIMIGEDKERDIKLEDFGGMDYNDWDKGNPFPDKSENRKYTCPAHWYQSADYKKKPNWDECIGAGSFSSCRNYKNKEKCWKKWDKEFGGEIA